MDEPTPTRRPLQLWRVGLAALDRDGPVAVGAAQQVEGGVQDNDDDEVAYGGEWKLHDDEGSDQHGGNAAKEKAERESRVIALLLDEARAGDRHQERT